ncbi:MAG: hypothetical protein GX591_01120 [Planctomycetes bacterium]|nr:hypothetical protein [Planctomycetota bacterium]
MDTNDIETLIAESLNLHADAAINQGDTDTPDGIEELFRIQTFAEAGLLTTDSGLVLHLDDGSTFQVTIVRSR